MQFNSLEFMIFFLIIALIYYCFPKKLQPMILLVANIIFYLFSGVANTAIMLGVTIITFLSALLLEKTLQSGNHKRSKGILVATCLVILGLLFYFKYWNFAISILNKIVIGIGHQAIELDEILLPLGISFYILQSLGYLFDVYYKKSKAEKNIVHYMGFLTFFPIVLSGPIERSGNLLTQLKTVKRFDILSAKEGLLRFVYGLFLKLVIADRLAITVNMVFGTPEIYSGIELIIVSMMYAIQIYCDFSGYSHMAIGIAKILGVELRENFRAPYLATSVSDFWKRWHISLTSWFRDYLYIPLGGNRKGKFRKYLFVMIVFLVSGLWHGATFSFIAWGGLNGGLMILEELLGPVWNRICERLKINRECFGYRFFARLKTFLLISMCWVFFRIDGIKPAIRILYQGVSNLQLSKLFGYIFVGFGISVKDVILLVLSIGILFFVDYKKEQGLNLIALLNQQGICFRWLIYLSLVFGILIYGIYGTVYEQTSFIYFQF